MTILISADDLIKRCLWSKYKKFVLGNKTEEELNEIIEKNESIQLCENDAYVIGLLRIVETENLIHRFKIDIKEFIHIKSTILNNDVLINKSALLKEVLDFKEHFPENYKPNLTYEKAISDLKEYIVDFYKKVDELEEVKVPIKDKIFTYIHSSEVRKIIRKS